MAAVVEKQAKRWTYEEYYRLHDDQRYEISEGFGVKEYWIGDPANKSLEILVLKDGQFELFSSAVEQGRLRSSLLSGLEFDLPAD